MKKRKPGKRIGGAIYVHRDYVADAGIPRDEYNRAQTYLPENFDDFVIVKYVPATGDFSFILSPDFDEASEPTVGLAVKISSNGNIHITKQKDDPQIYHHKWEMVGDDYDGFDVAASREWSRHWRSVIGVNKDISNRIGTKSYWEREILPKVK